LRDAENQLHWTAEQRAVHERIMAARELALNAQRERTLAERTSGGGGAAGGGPPQRGVP
jgi:hypothetical protein